MHHSVSWLLDRVSLLGGRCRLWISGEYYSIDLDAGTQTNERTQVSRGIRRLQDEFDVREGVYSIIINDQLLRMCEALNIEHSEVRGKPNI